VLCAECYNPLDRSSYVRRAMYLMLMGPPGAGKGTQADLLARRLLLPHISAGNLLRAAAAQDGPRAVLIRQMQADGEIITDAFVMDLISSRLSRPDCAAGAILDGCVRTLEQAVQLDKIVAHHGGINQVLVLRVSDRVAAVRLENRRSNAEPPESGRPPAHRTDDSAGVIPKRQFLYRTITEPVVDYYRSRTRALDIDGDQSISVVHEQIIAALDLPD
jgi:adenylate kinase